MVDKRGGARCSACVRAEAETTTRNAAIYLCKPLVFVVAHDEGVGERQSTVAAERVGGAPHGVVHKVQPLGERLRKRTVEGRAAAHKADRRAPAAGCRAGRTWSPSRSAKSLSTVSPAERKAMGGKAKQRQKRP